MKSLYIIIIISVLSLTACSDSLSSVKQPENTVSKTEEDAALANNQDEEIKKEPTDIGNVIEKNGAQLGIDASVYKNNIYKYKDYLITYEPVDPNAVSSTDRNSSNYSLYLTGKNQEKTLLSTKSVGFTGEIDHMNMTADPEIVFLTGGWMHRYYEFINIANLKHLTINRLHAENTLAMDFFPPDMNMSYPILEIEKTRFTLLNKDLADKCMTNENYKKNGFELNYLFLDNAEVLKLPESARLICVQSEENISMIGNDAIYAEFRIVGLTSDFQQVLVKLVYKSFNNTDANSLIYNAEMLFEFDTSKKTVKNVASLADWTTENNNIITEAL
jgi:hypothetical protein